MFRLRALSFLAHGGTHGKADRCRRCSYTANYPFAGSVRNHWNGQRGIIREARSISSHSFGASSMKPVLPAGLLLAGVILCPFTSASPELSA